HHGAKEPVGNGEVEEHVTPGVMGLLYLSQRAADLFVQHGLSEIALQVGHLPREPLPCRIIYPVDVELRTGVAHEALEHGVKVIAPALSRPCRQVHTDQRKSLRQYVGTRKIV